jgi:hypothetical protein
MPYIISAILVIAIASMGGFYFYSEHRRKRRLKAEVARIRALPMSERLQELLKARGEMAEARQHLASVRQAFGTRWGFRHNPYFSRLVMAQVDYSAAVAWVQTVEELCNEPIGAE